MMEKAFTLRVRDAQWTSERIKSVCTVMFENASEAIHKFPTTTLLKRIHSEPRLLCFYPLHVPSRIESPRAFRFVLF